MPTLIEDEENTGIIDSAAAPVADDSAVDAAPEYVSPDAPAASPAQEYGSEGLLGASVEDINTLTSGSSPLMRGADTRAKQAAQERGLLNTSMAIGAAEAERLNTVMPLVQQQAGIRGEEMLQEGQQDWQSGESALGREHDISQLSSQQKHDIVMEGLDADTRENLINIEQEWNLRIQQNASLGDFWEESIDGLMDIMNNPDLDPEGQQNAMNEMLGYTDSDGAYHIGTVEAAMNVLMNLDNYNVDGTVTDNNVPATAPTIDLGQTVEEAAPDTQTEGAGFYDGYMHNADGSIDYSYGNVG